MKTRGTAALGLLLVVASACVAAPGGTGAPEATSSGPAVTATSPPTASGTPSSVADWSPPPVPGVAGRDVYTVSRALAERDAGRLGSSTIALGGYWSWSGAVWSCPAPDHQPADLELYCQDGAFGITEHYESIMALISNGNMTTSHEATGAHLSPWIPPELQQRLMRSPGSAPVPIVVLGHFNDLKAAGCVAEVRQTCRNRFVLESLVAYDPAAAPAATPSPAPTPFPSPAPSGLFPATQCAGDVPYSFVGWTTTDTLHSTLSYEGYVWAVVTRDIVPTGTWNELYDSRGHWNLPMGRRVCVGLELEPGGTSLGVVLGTGYRQWDDGRRTTADDYGPGSGDPSLPPATSFPPLPKGVPVALRGPGVADAQMTIRDWSGLLASARPASDSDLRLKGSETGQDHSGAAVVLPHDPRSVLIVWAECGSDSSGTIVVTKDRKTVLIQGAPRVDCIEPGARRGAVLTFTSPVPDGIEAVSGLP